MAIRISLEKSKFIFNVDDPVSFHKLRQMSQYIPGLNMSKKDNLARSKQDQLLINSSIIYAKKLGVELILDQEVKDWCNTEFRNTQEFATIFKDDTVELPISYNSSLRKYQRSDVLILSKMKRAILGNDPGTGKTLECIALADLIKAKRVLVICPLSLIGSWRDEIKLWCDDKDTKIIPPESNYKRAEKMNDNLAAGARWNIVNYSILQGGKDKTTNRYKSKDKHPQLFSEHWDLIIVDEAHRLQNKKTQLAEGLSLLKSDYLVLATGTSMTKDHQGIFGLLSVIDPKLFTSRWDFIETYNETEDKMVRTRNGSVRTKEVIRPKNKNNFLYMLSKYMIRRRKEEVLTELPEAIHITVPISMDNADRKQYDLLQNEMVTMLDDTLIISKNVLAQQTKLRQFILAKELVLDKVAKNYISPRVQAILDIVSGDDKPKIIFSTSTKFLDHLKQYLGDYRVGEITGRIPFSERQEVVNSLGRGELDVILGTISAMGEGLNMQAADTVIFADKTWVPADQKQAIARVLRMGQKSDSILIYSIVMENTIDELVEMVNKERQDIIDEMSALHLILPLIIEK